MSEQREILFRGKRLDNGKWVEGCYLRLCLSTYIHFIVDRHGEYHQCDPSTVGQYTGLQDKDGMRIFDGDVLENTDRDFSIKRFRVIWRGGGWCLDFGAYHAIASMEDWNPRFWRIIGNIHDDQELLT